MAIAHRTFFTFEVKVRALALTLLLLWAVDGRAQKLSYHFRSQPLTKVLERIGADNKAKIAFDAQLVGKFSVKGRFDAASLNELITQLVSTYNLEVSRIGDVYVVKPRVEVASTATVAPPPASIEIPRFKIWGTITDVESGERLPYAYLYSTDGRVSTTANADGFFSLTVKSLETLHLCISYLGFEKRCVEVTPKAHPEMITIPLERIQTIMSTVTVTRHQSFLTQVPSIAGKNSINPRSAPVVPTLNPLDFTAPLQMLPGVDATTESSVGLNIRKSPSDKTLVLFDGFTIYHVNHFLGLLSAFNTKAIKDIQVYKGGFDARYGGSASAVLEITGKSGNRIKPSFSVGADLLSADASADMPLGKKWSLVVAARRSYTDIYQTPLYDKLFDKARSDQDATSLTNVSIYKLKYEPKYHFYDLHAKLTYYPDSTQEVSLSVYSGNDNMKLNYDKNRVFINESSLIDNNGVGLKWSKQMAPNTFIRSSVGFSDYGLNFAHINYENAAKQPVELSHRETDLVNNLRDITIKSEMESRLSSVASFTGGVAMTYVKSSYTSKNLRQVLSVNQLDTTKSLLTAGSVYSAFAQVNFSNSSWLRSLVPGIRASYFSPNSKFYWEPRVNVAINAAPSLIVKGAVGRYYQFINRVPIAFLSEYNGFWMISDKKNHPVVKSDHAIAGFTYDITPNFQVDIEGYLKKTDGMSYVNLVPLVSAGKVKLQQKLQVISSNVEGVDLLLKYQLRQAQFSAAYSLSRATIINSKDKVDSSYPSSLDQLHEVKLFGAYSLGSFIFSASWIYGSGKPWDEYVYYSSLKASESYDRNSERLSPYHRLDVAATYQRAIGQTKLSVSASIFNVYNRDNQLGRPYTISSTPIQDIAAGKSPIIYTDLYGLGFTPTLYVNLTF